MDMWNIAGILGMMGLLLAYGLQQAHILSRDMMRYHALNFAGAMLLIVSLLVHRNMAALVLEIIWVAITLGGMVRVMRRRSRQNGGE
jgi:arginine exporter protein ArgO